MFTGTLTWPLFNHLIGSSSSGFTELILTGEHFESGIKRGKIQVLTSSSAVKKIFSGKKETNVVYGQKDRVKNDRNQSMGAVLISNPAYVQQQQGSQCRTNAPRRQFMKISMPLSQVLHHLLKTELIILREPPQNPNTSSLKYNPNVKCAYHSNSPEHDTNNCWALKNKI